MKSKALSHSDLVIIIRCTAKFHFNVENAQRRKMVVELVRLHLQQFLSHNSFAECYTKTKNLIIWCITIAERAKAVGMLQQYDYVARLYKPPVIEYLGPENDVFSLD